MNSLVFVFSCWLRLFGVYEKHSQQVCSRVEGRMTAEHVFITRSNAIVVVLLPLTPAEVHDQGLTEDYSIT
jgi:hypothetical protein